MPDRVFEGNMSEQSDVIFTRLGLFYRPIAAAIPFKSDFMMLFYAEARHPNGGL